VSEEGDTGILKTLAPGFAWLPRWARANLSPRILWSLIALVFSSGISIALFEARLSQIERDVAVAKQAAATLASINTKLEVLKNDVGHIRDEVDDQKAWREHVEGEAEVRIRPVKGRR